MKVTSLITQADGTPIALPGATPGISLGLLHNGNKQAVDLQWFSGIVSRRKTGTPILINCWEACDPRVLDDKTFRERLSGMNALARAARAAGLSVGHFDGLQPRTGTVLDRQAANDKVYGGSGGLRRYSDWIAVPLYLNTPTQTADDYARFAEDIDEGYRIAAGKPVTCVVYAKTLDQTQDIAEATNHWLLTFIKERGPDVMVWNPGDDAPGQALVDMAVKIAAS